MVRNADGTPALETVKEYTRDTFSTDPSRISEVIADYIGLSAAEKRGIIFWSHASGWQPDFSNHQCRRKILIWHPGLSAVLL